MILNKPTKVFSDLKFYEPGVNAEAEVPLVMDRVNIAEVLKENWPIRGPQDQRHCDYGGEKEFQRHFHYYESSGIIFT